MRRTTCRTSSSAVAVTVQVLSTTKSASCTSAVDARPFAARLASIAAPSACEALPPKFWTKKRSTMHQCSLRCKRYTVHVPFTRRAVLKNAGALIAGAALPAVRLRAANQPSPVILKLGNYMAEAAGRALPEEVIEKTKHHILDTLAAMVSGAELPPGKVALAMAKAHAGERTATIVGSNLLCGPIEAAMI